MSWEIQYTGTIDTSMNVAAYNLDLYDTSADTIKTLHAQGKKAICYFSAGSYENWRPDAKDFPAATLGKDMVGWAGEKWLDVRNISGLAPVMKARMDMAKGKGCDAVDPDNVDGYTNDTGFPLKAADQLKFNRFLATEAHARGMAVSLKNDLDQIPDLVGDMDFAVNEQCFQYGECNSLTPFIKAGKPVLQIEYNKQVSEFCPQANQMGFSSLRKKLALDAYVEVCRK